MASMDSAAGFSQLCFFKFLYTTELKTQQSFFHFILLLFKKEIGISDPWNAAKPIYLNFVPMGNTYA
jgi:hypothetical protein